MKVKIIDAMPGTGKTTYAFQMMREDEEGKYIYCSPYLAEVGDGAKRGRIQKEIPCKGFVSPSSIPSKGRSFERLVKQGKNVAITHSLLSGINDATIQAIRDQGYKLVLDETLQPISVFQQLSPEDVAILVDANRVVVGEGGKLEWNKEDFPDYSGRDEEVKQLCDKGGLFAPVGLSGLLEVLQPEVITCFQEVTILTYMFEGSIMASWMRLKGIPYSFIDSSCFHDPAASLAALRDNLIFLEPSRTIKALHTKANGEYTSGAFSVSWYERNQGALDTIRRSLSSTAKKLPKSDKIFWTTFKKYEEQLQGSRYTRPEVKKEGAKKILVSPFVPKNMRASNEYRDYNTCFYCCNIYPHTVIQNYLKAHGVEIDKDVFALSEIVQFIFRGSIRQGKKMKLLVLSDRMRNLLQDFVGTTQ